MPRTSSRARISSKRCRGWGLALVLVLAGEPAARGAPDAAPVAVNATPPSHEDLTAARALLQSWARAQNGLLWKPYAALYAPGFQGIRRSGTRTVTMDREHWLAERARMFDQGGMAVDVIDPVYESDGADGVRVRFTQAWAAGSYADRGSKILVLRRDGGDDFRVMREEMLDSVIDHTPIVPEKDEDADLVKLIYPNNAGRAKDAQSAWIFTKHFEQSWTDTALGTLKVVLWSEAHNPSRHTQFDSEYFGGVAVIHDGRLLGARYGLEGLPVSASLIKAADQVILAVKQTSAFRGELLEVLEILVLTKVGLRYRDRIPVRMNDAGSDNTYDCEAKIQIRDVSGNGVPDIVVTPVRLRRPKACNGFPRTKRQWLF